MKLAIVGLVLVCALPAYAQDTPSLKDTLQWMHNFVDAHSYWEMEKSENNPMGIDRSRLTFNKCQATQTLFEGGNSLGDTRYSLGDIDPQAVKIEKSAASSVAVEFETTNSRDVIAITISDRWSDSIQEWCKHQTCVSSWLINFDSEENAKRFAKAFKHAVSLCGGKPSAF
jgi:hypothetical protein